MQTANTAQKNRQPAEDVNTRFWEVGEYRLVLSDLLSFLKTALATTLPPFQINQTDGRAYASPNNVILHQSESLDQHFHSMRELMSVVIPGYAYSPLLQLFYNCFQQHPWLRYCSFADPNATLSVVPLLQAQVFNDFVQMLRTDARQHSTWSQLRKCKSDTEHSQAASIEDYVLKLFEGGASLEPIRVDLQYHQSVATLDDAMPRGQWIVTHFGEWAFVPEPARWHANRPESRARIDAAVAMRDRARFFANVYRDADRQIFQYLRGYVTKMERGEDGANHIHCCFLFDAKRPAHLTAQTLVDATYNRWSRGTAGRGLIYSCHEPGYRRKLIMQGRWALDSIDGNDQRGVARLTDYLIWYFAHEKDQAIHIKPTAHSRAMTTGRLP